MGLDDTSHVYNIQLLDSMVFNPGQVDALVSPGDNGHVGSNDATICSSVDQTQLDV